MESLSAIFVRYALEIGALELVPEGRQLKSGRISPYFFNSGLFNDGQSLYALVEAYVEAVLSTGTYENDDPVLFGPAYKGIPLVVGVAMAMEIDYGIKASYAFNRKEAKDHGEGGLIVGAKLEGRNVLVIDDVMTTGTSSGEAVDIVRAAGGKVIGAVIAFDRCEKAKDSDLSATQQFTKTYGVPVYPAATLETLIAVLDISGNSQHVEVLPKIRAYQKKYGVKD